MAPTKQPLAHIGSWYASEILEYAAETLDQPSIANFMLGFPGSFPTSIDHAALAIFRDTTAGS